MGSFRPQQHMFSDWVRFPTAISQTQKYTKTARCDVVDEKKCRASFLCHGEETL
jgi:hypothetical protein